MSRLARKYNQQLKIAAELVRTTTTYSLPKYRPKYSSTRVSNSMHMLKPECDDNMKDLGSPEDVQGNYTKHYTFSSNHPAGIGQPFAIINHYNMSMLYVSIDTKALGIHFNSSSLRLDIKTEMISRFRRGRFSIVTGLLSCLPCSLTAWAKAITS